jgi:hypothetical protein
MENLQQRLYNDQLAWATKVVALAKNKLVQRKKIASGSLYNSIGFKISKRGQVVFQADDSADYVQGGRKPGKFPPPPAIAKWAKVKGLPRFRDKKGRYISNDSRAFLLGRAIAKKGIKPFPFYNDAIDESLDQLADSQQDVIADTILDSIEI